MCDYHRYFPKSFQDRKLKFPGLSRTKVIFQDFPCPRIFKKKSRTFREAWKPCLSLFHTLRNSANFLHIHMCMLNEWSNKQITNAKISTQWYETNSIRKYPVSANHRVTEKPLVPSGPRGCLKTLTADEEDSLLLLTTSLLRLCSNLITPHTNDVQTIMLLLIRMHPNKWLLQISGAGAKQDDLEWVSEWVGFNIPPDTV